LSSPLKKRGGDVPPFAKEKNRDKDIRELGKEKTFSIDIPILRYGRQAGWSGWKNISKYKKLSCLSCQSI
jgi:hypothetical protein